MYEEKQRFKWTNQLFLGIALLTLIPVFFIPDITDNMIAVVVIGITILLTGLLLYSMKQIIKIDEGGIHYKQSPFINKFRLIPWSAIQSWELTKINALKDFGGWGIRMTGSKTGYIIDGDFGLELTTEAKKKIVLSVKNSVEVEKVMRKYSKQ